MKTSLQKVKLSNLKHDMNRLCADNMADQYCNSTLHDFNSQALNASVALTDSLEMEAILPTL